MIGSLPFLRLRNKIRPSAQNLSHIASQPNANAGTTNYGYRPKISHFTLGKQLGHENHLLFIIVRGNFLLQGDRIKGQPDEYVDTLTTRHTVTTTAWVICIYMYLFCPSILQGWKFVLALVTCKTNNWASG